MVISLVACGSGTGSDKPAESTAASSEPAASTADTSAAASSSTAAASDVTLTVMVPTRPTNGEDIYVDVLPKLIQEKFPNIKIQVDQLPTDQYKSTVKMKFASGQGPDLFTWWASKQAEPLVKAGYVRDLSGKEYLKNFNPVLVSSFAFDGKTYAIPIGLSFLTTWYNKDQFAKAGIDKLPTNWEEFTAACEKLKKAGFNPITAGDKDAFVIQFAMYQIGASVVYGDDMDFDKKLFTGETKFTDPKWVETVAKMAELYQKGYVIKDSLGLSQQQSRQAFIDGKAAMIFDGSFGFVQLTTEGAEKFERGMFCVPSNEPGKQFVSNLTPAVGLHVNASSKYPEAIDSVIDYWFTKDTPLFTEWVKRNENISAYNGITDSRPLISEYLERYKDNPKIYNLNNAWTEGVSDAMCTKFQEVIAGGAKPQDVVDVMQSKHDQLTKK
jgi:raffinose/stachyose/melibiose transport system substrate-binding protein